VVCSPDAATGPDAAGQPAFHDPTPEFPGSGDEIALIPDGASPSMDVWRAHWNPHTKLFETDPATDIIAMDADTAEDRPRPTTVSIAPNGTAYVVFQRPSSIQRILDIDGADPRVELVGFTSDDVGTSALAAGYGPLGPMGPPTLYVGESTGVREIAGTQGNANRTTSPSTFAPAGFLASTLAYHATNTTSGQGTLYAGTASAVAPLVLPGPDSVVRLRANDAPESRRRRLQHRRWHGDPPVRRRAVRVRRPRARDGHRAARPRARVHHRQPGHGDPHRSLDARRQGRTRC
jgi:hypothetical protein